jgi:hypothetical protein
MVVVMVGGKIINITWDMHSLLFALFCFAGTVRLRYPNGKISRAMDFFVFFFPCRDYLWLWILL